VNFKSLVHKLICLAFSGAVVLFCLTGHSARTIKIVSSSGVQLTNPSAIAVNFDITCYSQSGSQLLSSTGQTLAPNASSSYGNIKKLTEFSPTSSACVAGNGLGNYCGAVPSAFCPGAVSYANAESLCSAGLELCQADIGVSISCGSTYGWVHPPATGTVTFSNSSCGWTTDHTLNTATQGLLFGQAYAPSITGSVRCSFDGGTSIKNYCDYALKTTAAHGAICCEKKTAASYCSVTINSSETNAFLASPQFKGGAAF